MGRAVNTIYATVINDLRSDQRMDRICTSLSDHFNVVLIGRELPDSRPLVKKSYTQVRLKCWFHQGPLFYLEYNLRLMHYLRKVAAFSDIINSVDADTLMAGVCIKRLRKTKLVFDAHEYFSEVPELDGSRWKKQLWRAVENWGIPQADLCYTVGPMLAQLFSKKYKVPFGVVRNCPLPTDEVDLPETPRFMIYQGALNQGRGLEHALRAMVHLNELHLKIIGDGVLMEPLKKLANQLQIKDRVHFIGFVEPRNLHRYTRKAFLGLNVSENKGLSYYYSLNNKCFDYIQWGIPAIANPFPEYQNLNDTHETMVFAEANDRAIAEAVMKLLKNEVHYQKLRDNCLLAGQSLNWTVESRHLIELYDQSFND